MPTCAPTAHGYRTRPEAWRTGIEGRLDLAFANSLVQGPPSEQWFSWFSWLLWVPSGFNGYGTPSLWRGSQRVGKTAVQHFDDGLTGALSPQPRDDSLFVRCRRALGLYLRLSAQLEGASAFQSCESLMAQRVPRPPPGIWPADSTRLMGIRYSTCSRHQRPAEAQWHCRDGRGGETQRRHRGNGLHGGRSRGVAVELGETCAQGRQRPECGR